MRIIDFNKRVRVVCDTKDTRSGFTHTATLMRDGIDQGSVKCKYYNRTWEAYEYDSVLLKLAEAKFVTPEESAAIKVFVETREEPSQFKAVGTAMMLGNLFSENQKESNDWKLRMLKASMGDALLIPDDWDSLTEDEKQARLDKIAAELVK